MANNAQNSKSQSDNLGRGRVAYAFKVSRVNPDFVSFKIWILGYYSKVCSIAVASLPKIVAQIDTALADGECEFEIGGIRFSAAEKLLKSIRKELSSYCCNVGASDANHVPSAGKAAQPQPESLRSTKPKASAPQGSASAARQIYNEERKTKNEERRTIYTSGRCRRRFGDSRRPCRNARVAGGIFRKPCRAFTPRCGGFE